MDAPVPQPETVPSAERPLLPPLLTSPTSVLWLWLLPIGLLCLLNLQGYWLVEGNLDDQQRQQAFLVGAGVMGELTARQLLSHGVGAVIVTNRTFERAIEVARGLGGMPVPWERLGRTLAQADLVIGAASGDDFLLRSPVVEEAMRERRRRPMFLIDLAVPRAFDPTLNVIDGVYLYDIDDLEGVIADNRGTLEKGNPWIIGCAMRPRAQFDRIVDPAQQKLEELRIAPDAVANTVERRPIVRPSREHEVISDEGIAISHCVALLRFQAI